MSKRQRHIDERLQPTREHGIIRYAHGKQISQRARAAREQSILRYV